MPKNSQALSQSLMQTSSQSNDPYFLFRDDLEGRLKKLQTNFDNWEVLLRNENTETSAAFKKAHSDLQKKVNTAKKMANELTRSVNHVKQNRKMFPHISENELASRQGFIKDSKESIARIQAALRSPATQGKLDSDRKAVLGGSGGGSKVKVMSCLLAVSCARPRYCRTVTHHRVSCCAQHFERISQLICLCVLVGCFHPGFVHPRLRQQRQGVPAGGAGVARPGYGRN